MRIIAIVIVCTAVVSGTSLGLNNGMVVCFDDHGHLAIEAAHVEHAHRHADGDHHGDEDFGIDPDHEVLHDAIASCFDLHLGQMGQHSARVHELRLGQPTAVAAAVIAAANLMTSTVPAPGGTCRLRGAAARGELVCLRAIILLV